MTKLPVGKTVAAAYTFTFNNLGAIIGLIWIPMLIVTVIGFFAQSTYLDALISYEGTKNAADLEPGFMWMLLFVFVALLGNAMMLVPVFQQALGKRKGHALAHFSLGPSEWRMFGAYLALLGIVLALAVIVALLDGVIVKSLGIVDPGSTPAASLALAATMFLVLVVSLIVLVRLAFFIPAIAVLEEKIDIRRGWALTRGNAWRIAAVILLIALPVVVLYFGLEIALFGPAAVLPHLSTADAVAPPTLAEMRLARERMPLTEALGFFIAPVTIGLNAGAVAAAYRALISAGTERQ